MPDVLISWIGNADLNGLNQPEQPGPLVELLQHQDFDEICVMYDQPAAKVASYVGALRDRFPSAITEVKAKLRSPVHFADIYTTLNKAIDGLIAEHGNPTLYISLTSGTPAMTAVSILVGKARVQARFLQVSREKGVEEAEIPFDIAADFLPQPLSDLRLSGLMAGAAPISAAFDDIITQNPQMNLLKHRAAILAERDVPVLIYGESGTGKELFARAIRNASTRSDKPFLVLNCGAIPQELIDATLFGHAKGAFTGANSARKGYFEEADGGTLFLDEFGELPLGSQVRLLRVLQDGTFAPVGSTKELSVDVRIIAATNKNLMTEVAEGRFREDLFYRVAIGVIHLPPLRERAGDLSLLSDALLANINNEGRQQPGHVDKKISAGARNIISMHPWPGNIRELNATLLRASLWQPGEILSETDIKESLIQAPARGDGIMGRDISQGIDINGLISSVCTHYIERALEQSGGSKSKAAELLGLASYQTLTNWMDKYGIKS